MEEVGRKAAEKAAKGIWAKISGALGIGEAELEVSEKGIRVRAPSVGKAKELLDYGAETQLKLLSQTRKTLSKAKIVELEDSEVRERNIRSKEDCDALVAKPDVKALPEEEKLRLTAFVLTSLGDREFHQKKFDMTEQAYHDAYELARKLDDKILQAICLNLIGAALGMQGRDERALPYFEQALRLEPDLPETWYNKGVALHELNRLEEAVACYDKAIEINPNFAAAWYNKGVTLHELNRFEEAVACWDKAIEINPDYVEAWCNKGVALSELNRLEDEVAWYDKAIEINPDFAEAWCNKGVALSELNRLEEAVACWDKAIEINPGDAKAWHNKGFALRKLGQVEEAKTNFQKAFSLREKPPYERVIALNYLTQLILEQGLETIASRNMKQAEKRALELAQLRKEAEKDDMAQVVDKAVMEFKEGLSRRELKLFDEFRLMFTILSAEDPLERWKALARKISEKWPKGVSAVEAIRKERQ